MSKEVIAILQSQIPLFEKLRRSAMLTHAMRGTITKGKLLAYVQEVQLTAWQIIQLNEHTIAEMEKELNGGKNDTSTTSEGGGATTGAANDSQSDSSTETSGEGSQLHSLGATDVDPSAAGTP